MKVNGVKKFRKVSLNNFIDAFKMAINSFKILVIMRMSLTIIIPVFNEEECLERLHQELNQLLMIIPEALTVLFVNDGSTDKSQSIIESICSPDPRYHFIRLDGNYGLSTALKAGFERTTTDLVGYMDADLQTSPIDFLKLLDHIHDYDMVLGIRAKRMDGPVKRISSFVANRVRRWLIDDGIADTGCPLKIIKTEYAKAIPFFDGMHRFIPALILLKGGKVKQIPVRHFPRIAGKSKYNLRNRLIHPFIDTLAFSWMKKRNIHYLIEKEA